MEHEVQNKIYWYCFKRQLEELYYLLFSEKYISCDSDEFISHFTGKKFRIENNYSRKLEWIKEKYLLLVVINHLIEKKFIDPDIASILSDHFENIPDSISAECSKNTNKPEVKSLQSKLDILFPAETGYRCKLRLYYKARNKENVFAVLEKCGIDV